VKGDGIHQGQLSHYVTGKRNPSKNTIRKIDSSIRDFAKNLSQVICLNKIISLPLPPVPQGRVLDNHVKNKIYEQNSIHLISFAEHPFLRMFGRFQCSGV
jgi:hypothetical protein